ncbi:MAG: hypothetical protein ACYDH6_01705 [Acidimicrobiales bacterium]
MVPFASKALCAFSALVFIGAAGYGIDTSDALGTTTLAFIGMGAAVLAVAVALASADAPPWIAPDTPHAEQTPVGGRPSAASVWPLGAAIGFGLLALGAATNGEVQLGALVVLVVTAAGWVIQHWTEDPRTTRVFGWRLRERFVLPFGLPVAVVVLVAIIAISMSRVFLALPENGTRGVALLIALLVLTSAFVISASARMARTALALLTGFALASLVAAGLVGIIHGERKFERPKLSTTFVPLPGQAPPTTTAATTTTTTP